MRKVRAILVLVAILAPGLTSAARRRVRSTTATAVTTTRTTPAPSFLARQLAFAGQPEDRISEVGALWDSYDIQRLDARSGSWWSPNRTSEEPHEETVRGRQYPGFPTNLAANGDTNELPSPISPQPSPPPLYKPPPGCLGQRGQYPSPRSCANYLNCWDDVVVEQTCPDKLLFNDVTYVCDYNYNVNCGNRPPATPKPLLSAGSKRCPDLNGRYRSSTNCSEFYVCVVGKPVKFCCPRTLVYNDELNVCDYLRNVDCKGTATPKPEPTQPPTEPPPSPTKPPKPRPTRLPQPPSIYPSQQPAYPSQQPTYPSQQPTYPSQQPAYPSQQPNYPSQQPAYPSQQPAYPSQQPNYPSQQPNYPSQQPNYPSQQPAYPSQQPNYPSQPSAYPTQQPTYLPQSSTQPSRPATPPPHSTTDYPPKPPGYNPQPYPTVSPSYQLGNPWLSKELDPWHQRSSASQLESDSREQFKQEASHGDQSLDNQSQNVTETSSLANPWTLAQTIPPELTKAPCNNGDLHKLNEACTSVVICRNNRPQAVRCSTGYSYDKPSDSCRPFNVAKC